MKHTLYYMAALLSVASLITSCDKVEKDITPKEQGLDNVKPGEMVFTTSLDSKTKSVTEAGVATWVVDEKIAVYYQKTDDTYDTVQANVDAVDDGVATISAVLTNPKNSSEVKFVYPYSLANETGGIDVIKLKTQNGTIADISANFDAATATATLVVDETTCSTSSSVAMANQVFIGKFTPKYNSSAIDGINKLIINDGTNEYEVTPSEGSFGTTGIYVAMLPVDNKGLTIAATTASDGYVYTKAGLTLAAGKLYSNLTPTMKHGALISTSTTDALRVTLGAATTGDTIVMLGGTYVESNSNYIAFTGKEVTVMPAAGAEVILQPKVPITISGGAKAEFNNIKFDSSKLTELANWYEHLIYASDANANNRLVLEGCEMYGFNLNKSAIYCSSSNKLKSVSINNCYFHDMKKSCFFSEGTSVDAFTLTNSTIANISTNSESYWAGIFDPRGSSVVVTVDHCTFYNCQAMNTDYAAVKTVSASTSNVVSNCIFMMPESYSSSRAVHFADEAKGNIKNCLTYNYTASTNGIRNGGATKANCLNDDPLFADAANNDFTLGALSPARTAGVESKPIGDPRWYE